ncbi:Trafficking protein particle complex subunit 6B [Irineochytrium annulatum]|nr:Trafficking protein particle complex subunit 6B [Irineochytrium annulatum]
MSVDERRYVAESCLEFLMIEIVDIMHESPFDTENDREAAYFKLEALGYKVGAAMAERITKERPRFVDSLDIVKFICKDFWIAVFKKQIDNLKTNHRHLAFPCGLIRGALANLGVVSVVIAEVSTIPQSRLLIAGQRPVQRLARSFSNGGAAGGSSRRQALTRWLESVQQLQTDLGETSPAWINRVARTARFEPVTLMPPTLNASSFSLIHADNATTLKIAVIGESTSGKEELVNALLEMPRQQALRDAIGPYDERVHRLRSSPSSGTSADDASAHPSLEDHVISSPFLTTLNAELFCLPMSLQRTKEFEDAVHESDVTILITSALRPLQDSQEVNFVERFVGGGKRNVVVAVNHVDFFEQRDGDEEVLPRVNRRLEEILSDASDGVAPKVYPLSTRGAIEALSSSHSSGFASQWERTGLQPLKASLLAASQSRNAVREAMVTFTAAAAARRLRSDQESSSALLGATAQRVRTVLVRGIVKGEERLHGAFERRELEDVQVSLAGLTDMLREYLRRVGLVGLTFRADGVADDVRRKMGEKSLLKAEYQMAYAVGRLNEGLYTLYDRTQAELSVLTSEENPLSAYKTTKAFQNDVSRILAILDKQRPPAGVEVDPFKLRNIVATFDESNLADGLQESAERLVRRHLLLQFGLLSGGVFMTYLGTPWAVSLPSTLAVCAIGFGVMKLSLDSVKDRFISKVTEVQKTFKDRLLTTYTTDFRRVVADPLASIVKLVDDALEIRLKEAEDARERADKVLAELKHLDALKEPSQ